MRPFALKMIITLKGLEYSQLMITLGR